MFAREWLQKIPIDATAIITVRDVLGGLPSLSNQNERELDGAFVPLLLPFPPAIYPPLDAFHASRSLLSSAD